MRRRGIHIPKTDETLKLEKQIFRATKKQGVFGCFEVTIGWFGNERVDYLTYDTKGVWRCYEIKVSVSDFRSKSKKTFCGHYNYFVMTEELFEKVKGEIPSGIGVYIGNLCKKRAKKRKLTIDEKVLKDSMIRSLSREVEKVFNSEDSSYVDVTNRQINHLKSEVRRWRNSYHELMNIGYEKYGSRWYKEPHKEANHPNA